MMIKKLFYDNIKNNQVKTNYLITILINKKLFNPNYNKF